MLAGADKGMPLDTNKVTVGEWLDRWLSEYVVPNTRQRTRERYQGAVRKHIIPHIGHIQLQKLAPMDIQGMEAKLLDMGLSTATVDLVHNVMSGAMKFAVRMEAAWRNPVQAVTPPTIIRKEVEPPDIPGVRRILELANTIEHPFFACFHLIAYTGIRRGEALGLRWQDVDLDAGVLSIVQTLVRANDGLLFQPPKTKSGRRVIDLDGTTIEILRAHRGRQMLLQMQVDGGYQESHLVFANPTGGPLNPMAVTRAFQSLALRTGITGVTVHDLRHFHASVMLQQGQSPVLVSKRLGHASVSTTMDIYSHILPGWQKEAANAFAQVMDET